MPDPKLALKKTEKAVGWPLSLSSSPSPCMPPAVLFVRCDRCMDNATSYLQQRCKAKASWVE